MIENIGKKLSKKKSKKRSKFIPRISELEKELDRLEDVEIKLESTKEYNIEIFYLLRLPKKFFNRKF